LRQIKDGDESRSGGSGTFSAVFARAQGQRRAAG